MSDETDAPAAEWAIVEIMGHRVRAGRIFEERRFGAEMLRVDIPLADGDFVTEHYGGAAIFPVSYTTEDVARRMAEEQGDPRPVLPRTWRPAALEGPDDFDDGFPI